MARKKKVITVKGSTTKKQAQKKKGVSLAQSLTVNVITGRRKASGKIAVKPAKPPIIFSPVINLAKPENKNTYTDYIKTPTATYSIERPAREEVIKPLRDRRFPEDSAIMIDTNRPSSDYFFSATQIPAIIRTESRTIGEPMPPNPKFQFEQPEYFIYAPSKQLTEPVVKSSLPFNTPSSYWLSLPSSSENISQPQQYESEGITRPAKTVKMSDSPYLALPQEPTEATASTPASYQYEDVSTPNMSIPSLPKTLRTEQKANKSSNEKPRLPSDFRPTPAYLPLPFEDSVERTPSVGTDEGNTLYRTLPSLPVSIISNEPQFELSDFPIETNPEGFIKRKAQPSKTLIMPIEPVSGPALRNGAAPAYTDVRTKFDGKSSVGIPPSSRDSSKATKNKLKIMPIEGLHWEETQPIPVSVPVSSIIMNDETFLLNDEKIPRPPKSRPTIPLLNVDENIVLAGDLNVRRGRGRPIKSVVNPSQDDMRRLERAQRERERYQNQTPQERAQIALVRLSKKTEREQKRAADRNTKDSNFNNPPFEDDEV